jgi:cation diffusion facilitator family transporter
MAESGAGESRTAVLAALLGNAALAALKGVAAALTGSAAMLAETFHSLADTGNEALLFLGMRLAARPPDARHPFGYGKDVYFWAFVVSVMLFTLGGGFSIWEAVRHYLHPVSRTESAWAYGVLAGGFVFESVSLGFAVHGVRAAMGDASFREYWRDARDPTLLTVLLEDCAALVSLPTAAAGLWLTARTGNGVWDAVASGVIGVLLLGVAVVLAVQNYSLLIGETAPRSVERRIRRVVDADAAVTSIRALRTMHLGPRELLVVLDVDFRDDLTASEIEDAVARLRHHVGEELKDVTDPHLIVVQPARVVPAAHLAAAER